MQRKQQTSWEGYRAWAAPPPLLLPGHVISYQRRREVLPSGTARQILITSRADVKSPPKAAKFKGYGVSCVSVIEKHYWNESAADSWMYMLFTKYIYFYNLLHLSLCNSICLPFHIHILFFTYHVCCSWFLFGCWFNLSASCSVFNYMQNTFKLESNSLYVYTHFTNKSYSDPDDPLWCVLYICRCQVFYLINKTHTYSQSWSWSGKPIGYCSIRHCYEIF